MIIVGKHEGPFLIVILCIFYGTAPLIVVAAMEFPVSQKTNTRVLWVQFWFLATTL